MQNYKTIPRYLLKTPIFEEPIPVGVLRVSKLIKVMRLSRGYTQKRLAEALGTKRQHVQKWEYGLVKPRPERMAQILDLLKYGTLTQVITQYYR
jgi:transcriptional regulator with XRE-family HTH domain